jgi:formylglycine-generating enzyme required for sulfatase activity
MGSDVDSYDQRPAQVVFVSTFRIGTYEATNGEWRACAAAGVCRPPERTTSPARTWPPVPYYDVPEFTHHPVTCMRNEQAALFCEWVGGRLPTEAEWEKAARGGYEMRAPASCGPEDEVLYPWGNAPPDCTLANYQPNTAPPEPLPEPCVGDADVAGARAAGASAYGVHDMAGNVREWVQDLYDPTWYRDDGPPWIDPTGPTEQWSHALQVDRGWNFGGFDQDIRVSVRHAATESLPWESCMGLRCAWPGE